MPSSVKIFSNADAIAPAACDNWRDEPVNVTLGRDFLPSSPARLRVTAPAGGLWWRLNPGDNPNFLGAGSTVDFFMTGPANAGFGFILRTVDASRTVAMAAI